MPTEVVAQTSFLGKTSREVRDHQTCPSSPNTETMSGNLTLQSMNGRRQGVHVKVYRTSLEHFAILYPQKKICRPLGVLNLKNTRLETLPDKAKAGFTICQNGYDTPMALTFYMEIPRELDDWIVAFTNRGSPTLRHSSLPSVQEDEEV